MTPTDIDLTPTAKDLIKDNPLSEMALAFVQEYISDPTNATAAAKRAGYSIDTAREQASRLMADPRVKKLIQESLDKAISKIGITAERIIQRYWKIASADPGDIVTFNEEGEAVVNSNVVAEVSVTQMGGKDQKKVHSVTSKTVKTSDQLKALDSLADIMNLKPEKKTQEVNMSFAQLVEASIPKENKAQVQHSILDIEPITN